jgi:hypothetical protein
MDEEEDELEDQISGPPSPQQAPRSSHPYSSNAMRQHLPAVAPEDSSVSASWEACKSASMATAGANKVKRGGYKVRSCTCGGPVDWRLAAPDQMHPELTGCLSRHRTCLCLFPE